VAVPETAVDEDRHPVSGEDEVGLAWKVVSPEAEAKAEGMGGAPDGEFGRRVGRLHGPHHGGTFARGEDVGHQRLFPDRREVDLSCGNRNESEETIMARTTHRSSKGTKLYAVRDAEGQFKDIQTYKRAHGADIKRKSKAEGAAKKAAKKKAPAKKKAAKKK
jgi:hypothetical protein